MGKGDNYMFSDKQNMLVVQKEYESDLYIDKVLNTDDIPYIATLSDINDNCTNNGEQILTILK